MDSDEDCCNTHFQMSDNYGFPIRIPDPEIFELDYNVLEFNLEDVGRLEALVLLKVGELAEVEDREEIKHYQRIFKGLQEYKGRIGV